MRYKVGIILRAHVGMRPNADPIDLVAYTFVVDASNENWALKAAASLATEKVYEERGGGPFWIPATTVVIPFPDYEDNCA